MSDFFKHAQAIVETDNIGNGTKIWAFAHVLPGAVIGRDCNICDHVFIENLVQIGDRVTVKCGVQLWDGVRIENDVFIGPNATFTNDQFPRSKQHLAQHRRTHIREGASIGANATILPGITVGQHSMVGAGAVVTRSVPPFGVVVGNPARLQRYVASGLAAEPVGTDSQRPASAEVRVRGVDLIRVPQIDDLRGNLIAREMNDGLPFSPVRCFLIFDVPTEEVRGEHAHRQCAQLLICVNGSVVVLCDDGVERQEFVLNEPTVGLHLQPMVWAAQYKYERDAKLLVLASRVYEPEDYIREYEEFLRERRRYDEASSEE